MQWIQLQNMCVKVRLSACLFAHLDTVIRVYVQVYFNEILKVTSENKLKLEKMRNYVAS